MVGPLLEQRQSPIASVTAEGAYDGDPVYRTIAARQPQLPPPVIIPPRITAVLSSGTDTVPSWRDRHIHLIQEKGRRNWEKAVGYGKRSLVETTMFRYQTNLAVSQTALSTELSVTLFFRSDRRWTSHSAAMRR